MATEKKWHLKFQKYMESIVSHPNYKGLPFERNGDKKIVWIAPKISEMGKKRIAWALEKAKMLGFQNVAGVYARVMFYLHPTKEKPCQICGRVMSLKYVYLNKNFLSSLEKEGIYLSECDTIKTACLEIERKFGKSFLVDYLRKKFKISIEKTDTIDMLIDKCENTCRFGNCKLLGPGAMSNFPDRLDGFHTYNRCCRKKEDTGRHDANMKTYNKDRRAYEYWSDGNIYAANKFMYSSFFKGGSADHIGPISLGFKHDSILLQKMSLSDNSAKRDRLLFSDVEKMKNIEKNNPGYSCASWFIQNIWNDIKEYVKSDAELEKYHQILKENMFLFMHLLKEIKNLENGSFFLIENFLKPKYEDFNFNYTFDCSGAITLKTPRHKTDASKKEYQRYERIALVAIDDYIAKSNRRTSADLTDHELQLLDELKGKIQKAEYKNALELFYGIMCIIQKRLCLK